MIPSILVLGAILLTIGAYALWRRGGSRKQVALMLLLVAIIAVNVAILVVPDSQGNAPFARKPT
jgi:NADH:ubiquinone oxidoreductase subunit K